MAKTCYHKGLYAKDTRIYKILEFLDCVEHLHSICSMYRSTHYIILGGDINENIIRETTSKRNEAFRTFMTDNELVTRDVGPTFVNAKHKEVSTLDFMLLDKELSK